MDNRANAEQQEYWNTVAGPRWVGLGGYVERRVRAVNDLLLARSAVAPGQRGLEIGLGTRAAAATLPAGVRGGRESHSALTPAPAHIPARDREAQTRPP